MSNGESGSGRRRRPRPPRGLGGSLRSGRGPGPKRRREEKSRGGGGGAEEEASDGDRREFSNESKEGDEWDDIEERSCRDHLARNEIIVKKKKVKVAKRSCSNPRPNEEEVGRPTSNLLPPLSAAFASYKNVQSVTAQEVLETVAQLVPNFETEQDKAHCPFHLKTGACRFGSRCSRVHFYPDESCTLLVKNMYNGPGLAWEQDEGLEIG